MRVADGAILICPGTRGEEWPVERYFLAIGSYNRDHLTMEKLQRQRRAPKDRRLRWAGSLCARRRHLRFRALVHRFGRLSFVSNLLFDHSDRRKVGNPVLLNRGQVCSFGTNRSRCGRFRPGPRRLLAARRSKSSHDRPKPRARRGRA